MGASSAEGPGEEGVALLAGSGGLWTRQALMGRGEGTSRSSPV